MNKADFDRIAHQLGDDEYTSKKKLFMTPPKPHHQEHQKDHSNENHHEHQHKNYEHHHSKKEQQDHKKEQQNHKKEKQQTEKKEQKKSIKQPISYQHIKLHNGFSFGVSFAFAFWFVTLILAGIAYYCARILGVL